MQDQSVYYVSGIYLPGHNLLSLPNTIAEMKHLRNLTISSNKIVYYPNEMFSMQTLEHFGISYMYGGLTSIPMADPRWGIWGKCPPSLQEIAYKIEIL